jgi:hypothetical protein
MDLRLSPKADRECDMKKEPPIVRKRLTEEFHKPHRRVVEIGIIRRDQALALIQAAAAGVVSDAFDLLIVDSLRGWMELVQHHTKAHCSPCAVCRTGFYGHRKPDAFLILKPFAATRHIMVVGICRRCADRDDAALLNVVLKALRALDPDLTTYGEAGRA